MRFCVVPLLFAGCIAAQAQTYEFSVLGSYPRWGKAALGSVVEANPKDDDTTLKGEYGYGVRFALNTRGYYGHEFGYIRNSVLFKTRVETGEGSSAVSEMRQDRVAVHQAFYNFLIYFMPREERFRPFITGGVQMYQYGTPHIPDALVVGTRNYGANYGGGLKIKLGAMILRADFRDYIGGKPYDLKFANDAFGGGLLHQLEGSVGIGIGF